MGKNPSLTPTIRSQVVCLAREGHSQMDISRRLNVARCAVQNALRKYIETGSYHDAERSGRPKKTTSYDDRVIRRSMVFNPWCTTEDVRKNLLYAGINLHRSTISRRLKAMDLKAFKPAKKPLLTQASRKKRLQFAKTYRHWTSEDWKKVLWSDECCISQFGHNSQYVRRPTGERHNERYTQPTVKHAESLMIWGCISANGPGEVEILEKKTRMDSKVYIDILDRKLAKSLENLDCNIFMQDSAPCHVSKVSKNWLSNHDIITLEWPGNSPDLNPIENIWKIMKALVAQRKPANRHQLEDVIKSVWRTELNGRLCATYVNSMPDRLKAVITARGGSTKY